MIQSLAESRGLTHFGTMATEKCLSASALLNVHVQGDLGLGIEIGFGLRLTNDRDRIDGFFSDHFKRTVGALETLTLLNADSVVYEFSRIRTEEIDRQVLINRLNDFMARLGMFKVGLWLLKDNSVDFDLCFSEVPHGKNPSQITSNAVAVAASDCTGQVVTTTFTAAELQAIASLLSSSISDVMSLEQPMRPPRLGRIGRALYLVQAARAYRDLGLKIGFYCTCLEALFSTSAAELSHKLAERLAYFISAEPAERASVYAGMKCLFRTIMNADSDSA